MHKRFIKFSVIIFLCLVSIGVNASDCRVTILHFNDLHGFLKKPEKGPGGAERIAGLVKKIAVKNEKDGRKTVVLFGGDLISGTPVSDRFKGEAGFQFLKTMKIDAMVIGNHDFDFGIEPLRKNIGEIDFSILGANIIDKERQRLFTTATYVIPFSPDCRVGILGLTEPSTPKMTAGDVRTLEFGDPVEYGGFYIDDLLEQSEVRVALTHIDKSEDVRLAKAGHGFDVIVGGHDHVAPDEYCKVINNTPWCETPAKGKYLGRIDLNVTGGRVVVEKTELIPVNSGSSKDVKKVLAKYLKAVESDMEVVVGHIDKTLYYRPKKGTPLNQNLNRIVVDAMRKTADAEIAFINFGGIRADLRRGEVTEGDIFEVLPFQNYVGSLNLTGGDIIEVIGLSEGAGKGERRGPRLAWSGLEYEKTGGTLEVKINGEPLDRKRKYKVATVDFLAGGDDGYNALKGKKFNSTGKLYRESLADYLRGGLK